MPASCSWRSLDDCPVGIGEGDPVGGTSRQRRGYLNPSQQRHDEGGDHRANDRSHQASAQETPKKEPCRQHRTGEGYGYESLVLALLGSHAERGARKVYARDEAGKPTWQPGGRSSA